MSAASAEPPAIRPIEPGDDAAVAGLIRTVMGEFSCTAEGFALHDPEVAAMSAAYPGGRARFFVVVEGGAVCGCGGFAPLAGGDAQTAELRKMYFAPQLRGRGIGRTLLAMLLDAMRDAGFERCYLETTSWMDRARALYEAAGFAPLAQPLGATGHGGCDRFYAIQL